MPTPSLTDLLASWCHFGRLSARAEILLEEAEREDPSLVERLEELLNGIEDARFAAQSQIAAGAFAS